MLVSETGKSGLTLLHLEQLSGELVRRSRRSVLSQGTVVLRTVVEATDPDPYRIVERKADVEVCVVEPAEKLAVSAVVLELGLDVLLDDDSHRFSLQAFFPA